MFKPTKKQESVFQDILLERYSQNQKWNRKEGEWKSHPLTKLGVLTEEVGEVAKEVIESQRDKLKAELIQVAAVAVAWLESIDDDPDWGHSLG